MTNDEYNELVFYYESRLSMMGDKGWSDLMEDLDKMIEARDCLGGLTTIEQLHFAKGELSIMNWLRTLKESSENGYEQLKESKDAYI